MITTCDKCGGLIAEPGEMYAGRGCECPLPPARGSASGPTWEEIVIAQVLAHLDALPEDWGNYSPHWRCGYNQARNKVAALLKARTPNGLSAGSAAQNSTNSQNDQS